MRTGVPYNENRFFLVRIDLQGLGLQYCLIHITISRNCYRRDSKWIKELGFKSYYSGRDKIFKSLLLKCSVTNVHNMYHAQYAQDIIAKNSNGP